MTNFNTPHGCEQPNNPVKFALDIVTAPRQSKPVPSLLTRLVFDKDEYAPPTKADMPNWQNIGDYMQAARPTELDSAQVLTGRVDSSKLVNQLNRLKDEDSFVEDTVGTRQSLSNMYAHIPQSLMEQIPASYVPHANSVILNNRSPGALIHELGHGIDLQRRPRESRIKRHVRWNIKPLLWQELSAWNKGQKAYQQGFAASSDSEDEKAIEQYKQNMQSINDRKYPAYGTYLGGAAGGLLGGIAGIGLPFAGGVPELSNVTGPLGAAVGGLGGALTGAFAGKHLAKWRQNANINKAMKALAKLKTRKDVLEIRARLEAIRAEREKAEKSKKTKKSK